MILIKNARIIADANNTLDGCILIIGKTIAYVGPYDDIPASFHIANAQIIDANDDICMPGLNNAHTHLAMTLLRGIGTDLALMDWLHKIWPMEDKLTSGSVRAGSMLGAMELIRHGITGFADQYFFMDAVAQVVNETGLKALLCRGLIGSDDGRLNENLALFKAWHNGADGRIKVAFGPHAEYTTEESFLKKVRDIALDINASLHVHISETAGEVQGCYERHGKSPVKYMHDLGMFELPFLAAHCVHVSDEDIGLLANPNVFVAHNPVSNLKLASGVAPIKKMIDLNVNVALGTDSVASNNTLNLFEEMKLTAMLHRGVNQDVASINAKTAFDMATRCGADGMGFHDSGVLYVGKKADIIMLNTHCAHMTPVVDLLTSAVYNANGMDVRMTMVDGKVLYMDGEYLTLDADKVIYEAKGAAKTLI